MDRIVRFEQLVVGGFAETKPRRIAEQWIGHAAALCHAFGLPPPPATRFDLPRNWGEPSGRLQEGMVFELRADPSNPERPPEYQPIGKVTLMREGERVRDDNPLDARDFYRAGALR